MPAMPSAEAQRAADQRQQHIFGQQLPHDAAAGRAHRRADRDLAFSRGGPHEQQVRDVRAGDEQHEGDGANQHEQRRPDVADHPFLQQLHAEAALGAERCPETCCGTAPAAACICVFAIASVTPGFSRAAAVK